MSRDETLDLTFDLINAFKNVKTPYETALLMQDLLTISEVKRLAKRLRIAKLLLAGKTQRSIVKELYCSLATITKVSIWLNEGGEGLKKAVSKLPLHYDFPKNLPEIPIEFQLPKTLLAIGQYSLAKNQKNKIKDCDKFLVSLENKKILDKSLQKAFDEEFRQLASNKKKKEFLSRV